MKKTLNDFDYSFKFPDNDFNNLSLEMLQKWKTLINQDKIKLKKEERIAKLNEINSK